MKTFKKTLIGLSLLSIVLIFLGFIFNGNYIRMVKAYYGYNDLILQEPLILEQSDNLEIDIASRNINIYKTNNESYIEYYLDVNKEKVEYTNNKVKISNKRIFNLGFDYNSKETRVVNVFLNSDFKNINVTLASGNINLEDLTFNSLMIKNTSGNINLKNVSITNAEVFNTSGNIIINSSNLIDLNVKNTSGLITVNNTLGSDIKINNTSGSIRFNNNSFSSNNFKTTSGNIKITEKRSKNEIGIKAVVTSGSIKINNQNYKEYDDTSNNFLNNYFLEVTSGNITFQN